MIDAHVHFWNFDADRDAWITDEMLAIRKDFLPKDLGIALQKTPISGCIAVQADQSEAQNYFLLQLAKENDLIRGIVGWVDFLDPDLADKLDYWKTYPLIKGFRHVLQGESDDFILNPEFIKGLRKLKNHNFTYDLLCYHHQLPVFEKLVHQLEGQKLILDHCAKPDLKSMQVAEWKKNIIKLAKYQNVHCKVSGLLTEADWKYWTKAQVFECLDFVFETFGIDRVVYGSDWPVMLLSRPYSDWYELLANYCQQFSETERNQFFAANAKSFYNLSNS